MKEIPTVLNDLELTKLSGVMGLPSSVVTGGGFKVFRNITFVVFLSGGVP